MGEKYVHIASMTELIDSEVTAVESWDDAPMKNQGKFNLTSCHPFFQRVTYFPSNFNKQEAPSSLY